MIRVLLSALIVALITLVVSVFVYSVVPSFGLYVIIIPTLILVGFLTLFPMGFFVSGRTYIAGALLAAVVALIFPVVGGANLANNLTCNTRGRLPVGDLIASGAVLGDQVEVCARMVRCEVLTINEADHEVCVLRDVDDTTTHVLYYNYTIPARGDQRELAALGQRSLSSLPEDSLIIRQGIYRPDRLLPCPMPDCDLYQPFAELYDNPVILSNIREE